MLQRYISEPYRVYAYLTEIPQAYHQRFDVVISDKDPDHAEKLNTLSDTILKTASDDDWIMFMDGDAFPVNPVVPRIQDYLHNSPLIAIQRLENLGEKHAHPAFCVTTVKFWKEIKGNWNKGYQWVNALNFAETDVGGGLLYALTRANAIWTPLHRTNAKDLVPVCYGIYGDMIYHHGAGFRKDVPRGVLNSAGVYQVFRRVDARILNNIVPARYLKQFRNSKWHPEGRLKSRLLKRMQKIDQEVTRQLMDNPFAFIESLRQEQVHQGV